MSLYIFAQIRAQVHLRLLFRGGTVSTTSSLAIGSHLAQIEYRRLPTNTHTQTHVHELTRPHLFPSASSDCIHIHLTPQIAESICLHVWLHVCRLRRCASFDLNSYPTAYYSLPQQQHRLFQIEESKLLPGCRRPEHCHSSSDTR